MAAPKKPKITSSSNRSTRSTSKPVTKGQNPQRANRQSVSKASVSSSEMRDPNRVRAGINQNNKPGAGRVTGTMGRPKPATPARVTTGAGNSSPKMVNADSPAMRQIRAKAQTLRQRTQNPTPRGQGQAVRMPNSSKQGVNLPRTGAKVLRQQAAGTPSPGAQARAQAQGQAARRAAETRRVARATSQSMDNKLKASQALRTIKSVASLASRGGAFAAGIQSYNTADGTLTAAMKRGDYKPQQGPKPTTTQASFNKKSFDDAFRTARSSGAKTFTWRGKKYTTKIKGE